MRVFGLTGGIGTGKSTVSGMLAELGAFVLDADKVGHNIYRAGSEAFAAVVDAFGPEIVGADGEIDRKRLGAIVFSDPIHLTRLNRLLHPRMYRVMEETLAGLRRDNVPCVVLEAAVLIEANWQPLVDEVWVTTAPLATVIERLGRRNNLTPEQVLARVDSQIPAEERARHADFLIDTDCTLAELANRLTVLWQERCKND